MKLPGIAAIVFAAGLAASPVLANSGSWHVVENLDSQSCYRITHVTPTKGGRDFGRFNTFRERAFSSGRIAASAAIAPSSVES